MKNLLMVSLISLLLSLGSLVYANSVSMDLSTAQVFGDVGYQNGKLSLGARGYSKIDGGEFHSLALKSDGTVWAWGNNNNGQLGDGTTTNRLTPVQVKGPGGSGFLTGIVAISTGGIHSLALKSDGTVWAWGFNYSGQLGDGTTTNRNTPVQVKGPGGSGFLTGVVAISAGNSFSLALKSDGTVWAWGYNANGQLGDNTTTDRRTPVQVLGPGGSGFLTDITAVLGGKGNFSLALKSDGTVWGWGLNSSGQLGDGTTTNRWAPVQVKGPGGSGNLSNIVAIVAGKFHSLALRNDGSVWAWGRNNYGQLGDDTTTNRLTPVQVLGPGGSGNLSNIVVIADGYDHSLALRDDGSVWAWGRNNYGQLGDGTTTDRLTPVQVYVCGYAVLSRSIVPGSLGSVSVSEGGSVVQYLVSSDGVNWRRWTGSGWETVTLSADAVGMTGSVFESLGSSEWNSLLGSSNRFHIAPIMRSSGVSPPFVSGIQLSFPQLGVSVSSLNCPSSTIVGKQEQCSVMASANMGLGTLGYSWFGQGMSFGSPQASQTTVSFSQAGLRRVNIEVFLLEEPFIRQTASADVNVISFEGVVGSVVCPETLYREQSGSCSVDVDPNFSSPLGYEWTSQGATIQSSGATAQVTYNTVGLKTVMVRVYLLGIPGVDTTRTDQIMVVDLPKPSVTIEGPRTVLRGEEATYTTIVNCPPNFTCESELRVDNVIYQSPAAIRFTDLRTYTVFGAAWVSGFSDTRVETNIRVNVNDVKKPFVTIIAPKSAEVGVPITLRAVINAQYGTPVGYWTLPNGTRVDGTELVYTPTEKTNNLRISYSAYIEGAADTTLVTTQSRAIKVDTYELPQFKIKSYVRNNEGYAPYSIALGVTGDMTKVLEYGVNLTHRWDLGDGTIKEGGNPKITNHIYSEPGTYTITLTVNDDRGNSTSDSLTITVLTVPEITIESFKIYPSNKFRRAPLNIFVRPEIRGGNPKFDKITSYEWTINGELVGVNRVLSVNINDPGEYVIRLTVTTAKGKTAYAEHPITVNENQLPTCRISYTDYPRTKTTMLLGNCTDSDGKIVEYFWDLGNGTTSKNARVYTKYENSGTYNIILRVKDSSGAEVEFTESITVQR